MRARLFTALLAAFAILAAPASAQTPTPTPTPIPTPTVTPTPTPEPTPERSDEVKAIYRDYRRDGELDACKHKKADLKEAKKDLTDEDDAENPDLRYLLEAAIEEHKSGDCKRKAEEEEQENTGSGTGTTGTGTTTPTPTATPFPTTVPDSTFSPSTGDSGGSPDPLGAGDLTPVEPDVTPVPPADAPPSTTIPPAEAGGTPLPAAPPAPAYANADDGVPLSLIILAAGLGVLALIALALALISRSGWGEKALAGPRRAWREAAFRAGGTWGDFADWMRVGR